MGRKRGDLSRVMGVLVSLLAGWTPARDAASHRPYTRYAGVLENIVLTQIHRLEHAHCYSHGSSISCHRCPFKAEVFSGGVTYRPLWLTGAALQRTIA